MDELNASYKGKNPFRVPEGYFDDLDNRIIARLSEEKQSEKVRLLQILRPYFGFAALFVVLWCISLIFFPLMTRDEKLMQKNSAELVQLEEELEEDIFDSEFNPTNEEIIEYLSSEMDDYEWTFASIYE